MNLKRISSELHELAFEDLSAINGGESLWYWIAYTFGAVGNGVYHAAVDEPIRPSTYR